MRESSSLHSQASRNLKAALINTSVHGCPASACRWPVWRVLMAMLPAPSHVWSRNIRLTFPRSIFLLSYFYCNSLAVGLGCEFMRTELSDNLENCIQKTFFFSDFGDGFWLVFPLGISCLKWGALDRPPTIPGGLTVRVTETRFYMGTLIH